MDREIPNDGDEIDAHYRLPYLIINNVSSISKSCSRFRAVAATRSLLITKSFMKFRSNEFSGPAAISSGTGKLANLTASLGALMLFGIVYPERAAQIPAVEIAGNGQHSLHQEERNERATVRKRFLEHRPAEN